MDSTPSVPTITRPSRKVLIIKTGYTETLTNEPWVEGKVSLGDVLRTTAILHLYSKDFVYWLTDKIAVPLLRDNPLIKEVLEFSPTNVLRLEHEYYDIVINLEKNPGICALATSINAWQKYGFRFEPFTGTAEAYNHAIDSLYVARDVRFKTANEKHWLAHLFEMVGQKWSGEGYVIKEPELSKEDMYAMVAMNWRTGGTFDGKGWEAEKWGELGDLLTQDGITYKRQPLNIGLEEYIRWVKASSLVVSCDSLGLHLALALGKKVVGMFGPTPSKEIHPCPNAILIQRDKMGDITPEQVHQSIRELFQWGRC